AGDRKCARRDAELDSGDPRATARVEARRPRRSAARRRARMKLDCQVNGERRTLEGAPMDRLLDVLRESLGLTGTKEGCGEGECGACTVLLDGSPVLSCLVPLVQCEGRVIETVEGVAEGPQRDFLDRFIAAGGVQCGACTPGIVVTACALLRDNPNPSRV